MRACARDLTPNRISDLADRTQEKSNLLVAVATVTAIALLAYTLAETLHGRRTKYRLDGDRYCS